jgi:hypothetical protein
LTAGGVTIAESCLFSAIHGVKVQGKEPMETSLHRALKERYAD